jgi:hypothetical protein
MHWHLQLPTRHTRSDLPANVGRSGVAERLAESRSCGRARHPGRTASIQVKRSGLCSHDVYNDLCVQVWETRQCLVGLRAVSHPKDLASG